MAQPNFHEKLGLAMIASRELNIPSKGQPRGFYLKSYKNAFSIVKPIFGDALRWNISLTGREEIKRQLEFAVDFYKRQIRDERNTIVNPTVFRKLRNEKVVKRNTELRQSISVQLTFKYKKSTTEAIDEIKKDLKKTTTNLKTMDNVKTKTVIFNSKKKSVKRDISNFLKRFINSLGGDHYVVIFDIQHQESKTVKVYNALTVPLKASGASALQLFNEGGELIVDNVDEGNGTCVIDFIYNNYVKKYSRKFGGNGKFPHKTKEEIAEEITTGWIFLNDTSPHSLLSSCEPKDDYRKYNANTHGVCILQLEEFCRLNKISLRCLDTDSRIFHSAIYPNASRESMMVIIDDGHIYNIKDKTLRKSVQESGRGCVHLDILKKETQVNNFENPCIMENISYESLHLNEQKNIFITGESDLEDLYVELWKYENAKYSYKSNCNLMTQIKLKDTTIFYNPDYEAVVDICKNLSIPFDNQSLISLGLDLYTKVNADYPLSNFYSHFNTESSQFFQSARRDNWVTSYNSGSDKQKVSSVDICKCYSSILGDESMKWMSFSSMDEVRPFTGGEVIENAFYYVETSQLVLFQGRGVYTGEVVLLGLSEGLVSLNDIKFFIVSRNTREGRFKPFVEYVYQNCGKFSKYIINTFIGAYLGKTIKSGGKLKYTDNLNTASTAFFDDQKSINVFIKGVRDDKILYALDHTTRECLQDDLFILHTQIIQRTYIKVYNLIKANNINIQEDLIAVRTDNIIFKGDIICPLGNNIGDYREEKVNENQLTKIKRNTSHRLEFATSKTFSKVPHEYKEIAIDDEYNIEEITEKIVGKDVLLMGRAGTGKSYVLRTIYERLKSDGKNIVCSAFTHKAKKHLTNGMTLHKLFGFDINGNRSHKTDFKKVDIVIIDEVSMMPIMFYDALITLKKINPKIQFILCGDFNQLQPVGEEDTDFLNLRVLYDLCPHKLTLKLNKRVQDRGQEFFDTMEKALKGEKFSLPTTDEPFDINVCYTNKTRKIINRKLMLKYRGTNFKTMERDHKHLSSAVKQLKTYGNSQTIYLYEGLPLLCKGGKNVGELTNGDLLTTQSVSDEEVVLLNNVDNSVHTIKLNDMFIYSFYPAYCLTVHSAQGDTIDRPYAIYDLEKFPSVNMTYTALSRSTKLEYVFRGRRPE